jgi:hypothetical protein
MDVQKHVSQFLRKKLIEGITKEGTPDLKYYAFDWDDNIMMMPTKIMVLSENDEEVGMSTEDFREHRHQVGVEPFNYKGTKIVGYTPVPYIYFTDNPKSNSRFIVDAMTSPVGPAWNDFVECINGGSIFSIITARGHSPETLKTAVANLIKKNHMGIDSSNLARSLKLYRNIGNEPSVDNKKYKLSNTELNEYLDMCIFEPVTYGKGSAANPEEEKKVAMRKFISYCKEMASIIGKSGAIFKDDVANNEIIPIIGFSDDDPGNVKAISDLVSNEYPDLPISVYLTKGNEKIKYNK